VADSAVAGCVENGSLARAAELQTLTGQLLLPEERIYEVVFAAEKFGRARPRWIDESVTVAAGTQGEIKVSPTNGFLIRPVDRIMVYASPHQSEIYVTLQVDNQPEPVLNRVGMGGDKSLKPWFVPLIGRQLVLGVDNTSSVESVVTLELPGVEVELGFFSQAIRPLLEMRYRALEGAMR